MNNNSLLKDAIADAQAVKKLAEQTAIAALTESFKSQIPKLASSLSEEEMEDEDVVNQMEETDEDSEEVEEPVAEPADIETEEEPEVEDDDLDEIIAELEGDLEDEEEIPVSESEEEITDEELDEVLREIEDESAEEDSIEESEEEDDNVKVEVASLKRQLSEAMKTVTKQKSIINEVGILNSKLLYSLKIIGKYDLTNEQKTRTLEAFDRVSTLKEAKIVYVTLAESYSKYKKMTETKRGSSSKPIKSITKKVNESVINEQPIINKTRLQKLAGIK